MKCKKCGAELTDESKFCSYCGNQVEIEENISYPIEDNNIENSKESFDKELNINEIKEKSSEVINQFKSKINSKKQTKIKSTSVNVNKFGDSINFFKKYSKWVIIGLILFVIVFTIIGLTSDSRTAGKYDWDTIVLKEKLPQPSSNFAEVNSNSGSYLSMGIYKTSFDEYETYVNDCKNKGFNIDVEEKNQRFEGYNAEGYKLILSYNENSKKMNLSLDDPIELTDLEWPENEFTKLLQKLDSTKGNLLYNDEENFSTYVGNITYDMYKDYIELCKSSGFDVDVSDSDKSYSAYNEQKYKLTLEYVGANVIRISVKVPEYNVSLKVQCEENIIFSKYDVELYIDDYKEDTISHGGQGEYDLTFNRGTHKIKFVGTDDETDIGEIEFDILSDGEIILNISCHYDSVSIDVKSNTTNTGSSDENNSASNGNTITSNINTNDLLSKNIDDVKSTLSNLGFTNIKTYTEKTKDESMANQVYEVYIEVDGRKTSILKDTEYDKDAKISINYYKYEKPESVYYSSNDDETVKQGNQGVYSYKDNKGSYDVYWIIDFDDGYVYSFTEGNGDDSCMRFKIKSGTLNDSLKICYDNTGDGTAWYLHFNYVNSPYKLIVVDHYKSEHEFTPTTLTDALNKMSGKSMINA